MLLAEDNSVNQLVAARLLEKRGHTVVIAGNGMEALAAIGEHGSGGFDLILMDVNLPGIDGVQALARLRADASTAAIPVVALTAYAMKDDRARFEAAGFDGYLEKPVSVRELPGQVEALLRR